MRLRPALPLAALLLLSAGPAAAQFPVGSPQPPAAVVEQTRAAYRSAWIIVLGKPATDAELAAARPHVTCDVPESDITALRACMHPERLEWSAVTFSEAVNELKLQVQVPSAVLARAEIIDRGYFNAFGRVSSAAEQLYWENRIVAEKLWYAPVATAQLAWLNNPANRETERRATILRAYQVGMGRDASASDLAYWLPRSEHYMSLVAACRDWMYGGGQTTDLLAAVRRAASVRAGRPATEAEVKALLVKALVSHPTYEQMLSM
jgi:hypothetical protein